MADLNADGQAEVIVAAWTQKGSNQPGRRLILRAGGDLLHQLDLPVPVGNAERQLFPPAVYSLLVVRPKIQQRIRETAD